MNDRPLTRLLRPNLRAAALSLLLVPACGGDGLDDPSQSNSLQSAERDDLELHTRSLSGASLVLDRLSVERIPSGSPDDLRVQAQLARPTGDTTIRLELGPSYLVATSDSHELMLRLEGDNLVGHWAELSSGQRYGEFVYPREQLRDVSDSHPDSGLMDVLREQFEPGAGDAAELDELLPIIDVVTTHLAEEEALSTDVTRYFLAKLTIESQAGAGPSEVGPDQLVAEDPGGVAACENGCTCDANGTLCGACCDVDQTPVCDLDWYGWCGCTCSSGGGNCNGFGCEEHNY